MHVIDFSHFHADATCKYFSKYLLTIPDGATAESGPAGPAGPLAGGLDGRTLTAPGADQSKRIV